jgi:CubicO group peptidase (beta-lactamase class C family)
VAGIPVTEVGQDIQLAGGPEYSNLGYALLGAVAEAASAVPFTELVHERVFRRLGMTGAAMQAPGEAAEVTVVGHRVTGTCCRWPRRTAWRRRRVVSSAHWTTASSSP